MDSNIAIYTAIAVWAVGGWLAWSALDMETAQESAFGDLYVLALKITLAIFWPAVVLVGIVAICMMLLIALVQTLLGDGPWGSN